jgi:hypothetical protein
MSETTEHFVTDTLIEQLNVLIYAHSLELTWVLEWADK